MTSRLAACAGGGDCRGGVGKDDGNLLGRVGGEVEGEEHVVEGGGAGGEGGDGRRGDGPASAVDRDARARSARGRFKIDRCYPSTCAATRVVAREARSDRPDVAAAPALWGGAAPGR